MSEPRLRIAVQKSGRLSDDSFALFAGCGLTVSRGRDKLYARAHGLPIDILLVRDDDIPALVADGAVDLGIVGGNVFEEDLLTVRRPAPARDLMALGFARCKLMLAAPKTWSDTALAAFAGKRIATSYPGLTRAFLEREGVEARTVELSGSIEVAPRLRIADAVCDIVSTGGTLDANGLEPAATVFESEAHLIARPDPFAPEVQAIVDAFVKRVRGVIDSREAKYVMMNAPRGAVDAITEILPGAEAPTVLELAGDPEKVAIHAVCTESVFWTTLERLKANGASAILVLSIEKMLP
ncbi:MAG: ATP phosphoribosyltransferase [Pseudomonadota bacterium]